MSVEAKKFSSKKFFLEPPYLYLLNPEMLPVKNILQFPLVRTLKEFINKMEELPEVDYKIMGLLLLTVARIHRSRVAKAVSFEKELEKEYEITQKKEEFVFDKPLRQYMTRPETQFTSESASDAFYEQLMISLRTEGKKRERKRKKIALLEISEDEDIDEDEEIIFRKGRRKRRIRVTEASVFEAVVIDFDRIEIDILINEVLYAIRAFSKEKDGLEEIQFDEIIKFRVKDSSDIEKWKLEQVRILISLLYLVKEGFIEAWQDLETKEISIITTEKGMTESFGFKPKEEEPSDN